MGTSGTDKFNEYRGPKNKGDADKPAKSSGGPKGSPPGSPPQGKNKCEADLSNVELEEVGRCEYYNSTQKVPTSGANVTLSPALEGGRLAVVESNQDVVVGYLPVELNYLRRCMEQGFSYSGVVIASTLRPVPIVRVQLSAQQS